MQRRMPPPTPFLSVYFFYSDGTRTMNRDSPCDVVELQVRPPPGPGAAHVVPEHDGAASTLDPDACEVDTDGGPCDVHDPSCTADAGTVTMDDVLEAIGFGRTQLFVLLLCGIGWFVDAVETLGLPYVFLHIDAEWGTTVRHWGLLASCKALSGIVGALGFSAASDQRGRRQAFIVALGTTALAGVASAAAPGFAVLLLLRIMTNVGASGLLPVAASLLAEHIPVSSREACIVFVHIFFDIGFFVSIALSLLLAPDAACSALVELRRNCTAVAHASSANCTPDFHSGCSGVAPELLINCTTLAQATPEGCASGTWRVFVLALAAPAVVLLFFIPLVPESPSHLLQSGQRDRLQRALVAMARRNGKAIDVPGLMRKLPAPPGAAGRGGASSGLRRLWDRGVRGRTILVVILWAGCATGSEFFFWVTELGKAWGIPEVAVKEVMFIGRLTGPVAFISASAASRFGYAKVVLTMAAALCSVSTAAIAVLLSVQASHGAVAVALLALNFFFDMVWGVVYAIPLTIFDASCRASALSVGTSSNKVAALLVPFLSTYLIGRAEGRGPGPFMVWALGWAVAAVVSGWLHFFADVKGS